MDNSQKRLICGDVFKVLPKLGKFDLIIADPPDNISLKYNKYKDNLSRIEYIKFLKNWFWLCIKFSNISWTSFNSKWIFEVGEIVNNILYMTNLEAKLFINTFTFGQNNKYDCGSGFRPIVRIKSKKAPLYPDSIKVPSWRQLNGDKRANKKGKLPLDTWSFPRITGNCKERRSWHPTQHREAMIKRIIDFSTVPGNSILDCFSGTGTVLRVCDDRNITSIEIDRYYCKEIAKEHKLKIEKI